LFGFDAQLLKHQNYGWDLVGITGRHRAFFATTDLTIDQFEIVLDDSVLRFMSLLEGN